MASGEIRHAIRFTVRRRTKARRLAGRHDASSQHRSPDYPPMGQRFRLKAGTTSPVFLPAVQVILRALKKYGMILADNGSALVSLGCAGLAMEQR